MCDKQKRAGAPLKGEALEKWMQGKSPVSHRIKTRE